MVGVHITHRDLVSLGGESDGLVLIVQVLQNKFQDACVCETLTDVLEPVPLQKHLGQVFNRVLVWHHDHAFQFA